MRELETEFVNKGMNYREIRRIEIGGKDWRIYNRENREGAFTLAKIEVVPEGEVFGKLVPEREKFPSSESWGTKAFDFHSEAALHEKVSELIIAAGTVE